MVKVAVAGAFGKMGKIISDLCKRDEGIELVGLLERQAEEGVYTSVKELPIKPDVVIDFTVPEATVRIVMDCIEVGSGVVIGTTGLNNDQMKIVREASRYVPVLYSPNMSLGVNLMFKLAGFLAEVLKDKDYDVEIFEVHHRFKKDAPSGTASRLAEIIADKIGASFDGDVVYGRQGIIGPRKRKEIGVLSARMGDVVGEHVVYFATDGERLEIAHRATSRKTFARGAVAAAKWLYGKSAGFYSMFDVLGI